MQSIVITSQSIAILEAIAPLKEGEKEGEWVELNAAQSVENLCRALPAIFQAIKNLQRSEYAVPQDIASSIINALELSDDCEERLRLANVDWPDADWQGDLKALATE